MIKKIMIGVLSLGVLTACSHSPAKSIRLDSFGLPVLDRTNTVAGIDSDQNGIRDDIQEYINATYPKPEQQKAVSQYARSLQAKLLVDPKDKYQVRASSNTSSKAMSCIYEKLPVGNSPQAARAVQEILSLTTNTKQRLMAYMAFDKAMDGAVISLPTGKVCDD